MPVNNDNVLEAIKQHRELLKYVLDEVLVKLQNLRPQAYPVGVFIDHVNFGVDDVTLTYYDGQDDTQIFIPNDYLTLSDEELEVQIKEDIAQYNKEVEWVKARREKEIKEYELQQLKKLKAKYEPKEQVVEVDTPLINEEL